MIRQWVHQVECIELSFSPTILYVLHLRLDVMMFTWKRRLSSAERPGSVSSPFVTLITLAQTQH